MNKIFYVLIFLTGFFLWSCEKDNDFGEKGGEGSKYTGGHGVFVINEGNFGHGNASLSFLDLDSLEIENGVFYAAAQRPLGDVAFSMNMIDSLAWLVINNSARIEVFDLEKPEPVTTLSGFTSPRFIMQVSEQKAYVSDLYAQHLNIVDLVSREISGSVLLGRSSENMVMADGKVFVSFWSNYAFPEIENNTIMVVDPVADVLTDSVIVGKEPNSMVIDYQGKMWVLCSGGFMNEELPSLWQFDPVSLAIEKSMPFSDIEASPHNLEINGTGDTLYFLNRGVYRMSVQAGEIPAEPFIAEHDHLFYSLAVDPNSSMIYTSDAIDYQQRGLILRFSPAGVFIDDYRAGIIPGKFVFN